MPWSAPPKIDTRWACIAGDANVTLAAVVSSHFCSDGVYFPVFHFPSVDSPFTTRVEVGKDGYFARLLGTRAATHISNTLARLQPTKIVLLGLTTTEQTYLRALLPAKILIEIDTVADLPRHLPFTHFEGEPIRCRSSDLVPGFMLAKFTSRPLVIDEAAATMARQYLHGGEGIVVVETDGTVNDIAAVNYAHAINADIALVELVDRHDLQSLPQRLQACGNDRSHPALREIRRKVTKRITNLDFRRYAFATFFTVGLPYGLVLKNIIPCTYVLKDVQCGVFLASSIIEESNPLTFDSALLFSPEAFVSDETSDVARILENTNFSLKLLLGEKATVKDLAHYGGYYPFDLMHICSHGGETCGYYVTQEFDDREKGQHTIEYFEVIGSSPAEGDMVMVTAKAIFTTLDGLPWGSPPLHAYPNYVFEDMLMAIKDKDEGVKRVRYEKPIAMSCHIQCYDSIHQGEFQSLAGFGHPIVFNNTCSSSHEMAAMFAGAGARAYIGTLWSVGNTTATEAAKLFYKHLVQDGNVLNAFSAMTRSIQNQKYEHVYIFWGLHFTSVRLPLRKSEDKVLRSLVETYSIWRKKMTRTDDLEAKRNGAPVVVFLAREILARCGPERLRELFNVDGAEMNEDERAVAGAPQDDLDRGVMEIRASLEKRFGTRE